MTTVIEHQSDATTQLSANLEFARMNAARTLADKMVCTDARTDAVARYLNALAVSKPDYIYSESRNGSVAAGITRELHELSATDDRLHGKPSCIMDIETAFCGYVRDEHATALGSQRISPIGRAVTLTILHEVFQW